MAAFNLRFRAVLLFVLCMTSILSLSLADKVSTVNGHREYAGVQVQTQAPCVPTLIYNAAKMPSIANNIARRLPMTNGFLDRDPAILHFDTSGVRKDRRRNQVCSDNKFYHGKHPCPEPDQPPVVVGKGRISPDGKPVLPAFKGKTFVQQTHVSTPFNSLVFSNMIGTSPNIYAGMYWSCDEFPPATFVEGGDGASTYCAPQNHDCAGSIKLARDANGNLAYTNPQDSEQDWQSAAHRTLSVSVWHLQVVLWLTTRFRANSAQGARAFLRMSSKMVCLLKSTSAPCLTLASELGLRRSFLARLPQRVHGSPKTNPDPHPRLQLWLRAPMSTEPCAAGALKRTTTSKTGLWKVSSSRTSPIRDY